MKITVDEPSLVPPGLVLFAAFAVRQLAEDASATAGGASAAATRCSPPRASTTTPTRR